MTTTVEIIRNGLAGLDGTTLLDLTANGVVVDRTQPNLVQITVPETVAFGAFEPGLITGAPNQSQVVSSIAVKSDGGPQLGQLARLGPPDSVGGRSSELLKDFAPDGLGLFVQPTFWPPEQRISIAETQTGPHRVVLTLSDADPEDIAAFLAAAAAGQGAPVPPGVFNIPLDGSEQMVPRFTVGGDQVYAFGVSVPATTLDGALNTIAVAAAPAMTRLVQVSGFIAGTPAAGPSAGNAIQIPVNNGADIGDPQWTAQYDVTNTVVQVQSSADLQPDGFVGEVYFFYTR